MKKKRTIYIIALIAMVNMLGYGIIIPILYSYSKQFGLSDFQNGLLFAIFSLCQFAATPIIGRMSDKYGRRPLLIISIIGTALSFFLMAFAQNAVFLFLARALDGITAGNIPVAFAVISDSTTQEERPKSFGIVGASFSFGFIFGPAIAALSVGFGQSIPFLIAGLITTIAAILTIFFLPETNIHMGEVTKGKLFDFAKLWHTLFDPQVGITFLISLLFFLGFSSAMIYGFQPFAIKLLQLTEAQNAQVFTLFGIIGLIAQLIFVPKISKKIGVKNAFSLAFFCAFIALLCMSFSRSLIVFLIPAFILSLFNSTIQTLIPTILSRETDAKSQGSIMGLNASYQGIGMILGPLIGGAIATIAIPLPFLFGSILCGICFLLSFKTIPKNAVKESAF